MADDFRTVSLAPLPMFLRILQSCRNVFLDSGILPLARLDRLHHGVTSVKLLIHAQPARNFRQAQILGRKAKSYSPPVTSHPQARQPKGPSNFHELVSHVEDKSAYHTSCPHCLTEHFYADLSFGRLDPASVMILR